MISGITETYDLPAWLDGASAVTWACHCGGSRVDLFHAGDTSEDFIKLQGDSTGISMTTRRNGNVDCPGNWYTPGVTKHIAVVFENGYFTAYADGVAHTTRGPYWGTLELWPSTPSYRSAVLKWGYAQAEFAIWNAALSAKQIRALADGASPLLVHPKVPKFYQPLFKDGAELIARVTPTYNTGTLSKLPHPRKAGI